VTFVQIINLLTNVRFDFAQKRACWIGRTGGCLSGSQEKMSAQRINQLLASSAACVQTRYVYSFSLWRQLLKKALSRGEALQQNR